MWPAKTRLVDMMQRGTTLYSEMRDQKVSTRVALRSTSCMDSPTSGYQMSCYRDRTMSLSKLLSRECMLTRIMTQVLIQLHLWKDQRQKCQFKRSYKQRNQSWTRSPLMRTPTCQFKISPCSVQEGPRGAGKQK